MYFLQMHNNMYYDINTAGSFIRTRNISKMSFQYHNIWRTYYTVQKYESSLQLQDTP